MATVNYDGLARDYAQHRRAVPSLTEALVQGGSLTRGSRVLELGCGTGNYIRALEDAGGCACWGIDRSGVRAQAHANGTESGCYAAKAVSSLHAIPQDAFERGLARLERDLSSGPVAAVLQQTALRGSKPGRASSPGKPLETPT